MKGVPVGTQNYLTISVVIRAKIHPSTLGNEVDRSSLQANLLSHEMVEINSTPFDKKKRLFFTALFLPLSTLQRIVLLKYIFRHPIGRAIASLLEKIIFISKVRRCTRSSA